jgi:hypothetical protein
MHEYHFQNVEGKPNESNAPNFTPFGKDDKEGKM